MDNKIPDIPPGTTGYIAMIALSGMGGIVSFLGANRNARRFLFAKMFAEFIIAGFTGVITYHLCEWRGVDKNLACALCCIAGYMGNRALALFESLLTARFQNVNINKNL